jgi:hypothetical protein
VQIVETIIGGDIPMNYIKKTYNNEYFFSLNLKYWHSLVKNKLTTISLMDKKSISNKL